MENPVLQIVLFNILPLFILILVGMLLGRTFKMDVGTLNKINFYVTLPTFTFTRIYMTEINQDQLLVAGLSLLHLLALYLIGITTGRKLKQKRSVNKAFLNALMFSNTGNIGVPLISLVFSTGVYAVGGRTPWFDLALTTHTVVHVAQNAVLNTFGFFNASRSRSSAKQALINVFRMPAIYAVILALILKLIPADLSRMFFWPALQMGSEAMIFIALLSLGVQLTVTQFSWGDRDAWVATLLRLLGSPLIALLLIRLFSISGIIGRVLFISSSLPTAINTALMAVEFDSEPQFSTQIVMMSTVFCGLSLVLIIWLSALLFPL